MLRHKMCGWLARSWFTVVLVAILLLWTCGALVSYMLFRAKLLRRRVQGDLSIAIGTLCARLLFLLCPFVQLRHVGSERWQPLLAASATRAPMLLMNHTSFLDLFIMCHAVTPAVVFGTHLRCIIAAKLTRLPLVGNALGRWSGNFPAYFKAEEGGISGGDGASFAIDQTKQKAVTEQVVAHVGSGGMLGVCPEGTVNSSPAILKEFRHGSFRIAIEHQMPIFGMVTVGADACWPKRAILGGLPSTIYVSDPVHLLTPSADMDSATVADECRRLMQLSVDDMRDLQRGPLGSERV